MTAEAGTDPAADAPSQPESRRRAYLRQFGNRKTLPSDIAAGAVLGIQSVPNALATALLAVVNPVYGIYAYIYGMIGGALTSSSVLMVATVTSAMAVVMADIPQIHDVSNPDQALFTLAMLTGLIMLVLGLLRMGRVVRFVPASVVTGFVTGVAVNIILAQVADFTGFAAEGSTRIDKVFHTAENIESWQWQAVAVGLVTIALIVGLGRTRLGAIGMVIAVVVGSAMVPVLGWSGVATVGSISPVPSSLPGPVLPDLSLVVSLIVPAISLAFIGLVQGAAISTSIPNPDGEYADASGDFRGQGVACLAAGVFQGMPVAGSMTGTAVNLTAGAKSRLAPILASIVMIIGILFASGLIAAVAMPVLAGLLIVIGFSIIRPREIWAVWRTGATSAVVMIVTFVLTLIMPLQYAVLAGVVLAILLFVLRQSEEVRLKRWVFGGELLPLEVDPPEHLRAHSIVVLAPYGSLFFAAAPIFEQRLPKVTPSSRGAVVLIIMRDKLDLGNTFIKVLARYNAKLNKVDSVLKLVEVTARAYSQLESTHVLNEIGDENVYPATERVGESITQATLAARGYVDEHDPKSHPEDD
ncbi:MAG: SulP family inorganic anion transporter [Actinobacteria bacterium]|nr:SulP family inorganic anion transporter [Actinomycetota bacterium]